MKKILAIVLALAMILSLAACGSKAEETKPAESVKTTEAAKTETVKEEKEPVTLEFLCWGAAEETTADAFKAMLDGFMEKYPWITVEVTESNYDAVNTSLLTRIAAQDAPDVAQVSNQWVATYYEMGGLLPLDERRDTGGLLPRHHVRHEYRRPSVFRDLDHPALCPVLQLRPAGRGWL